MGRSPASVASLNASAKRKPLSLKPERKNSPKKASKFVVLGDKENHTAAYGNQMADVVQSLKKTVVMPCTEESEERAALRKRVEEAVAFHRANRSPPGTPAAKVISEEVENRKATTADSGVDESIVSEEGGDFDADIPAPSKSSRGQTVRVVLAVLLVFAMAVWSGVRVALLEPDNALVKYEPYVRQSVDFLVSKFDAITARPPAPYSEEAFIPTVMPSDELFKVVSEVIDVGDNITCFASSGVSDKQDETPVEPVEDVEVEEPQVEVEAEEALDAEDSVPVKVASQAVLQLAPPVGRSQLALRKAFDILTPLKKVLAKIQDKLVHVMHGISRFFQRKTK